MKTINTNIARCGTILIVVAGLSALLVTLALSAIMYSRNATDATRLAVQEAQARLMLHAACSYVLEASRMGYGQSRLEAENTASSGIGFILNSDSKLMHREGFGWIDVRNVDGRPGPLDQLGQPVYSRAGVWPAVGGTVVCPMQRWTRPPYAIKQTISYNPIYIEPTNSSDPRWGRPLLLNPDPQPQTPNGWPNPISDSKWSDHVRGDSMPAINSTGIAWFRVHRASAATFIVTCGAGGTMGYRNWDEVKRVTAGTLSLPGTIGDSAFFNNDESFFNSLRSSEVRLWYEIRWSAAIRPLDFRYEEPTWWRWLQNSFAYRIYPVNGTQYPGWSRANRFNPNPVGTLSYIQRLDGIGENPKNSKTGLAITNW